MNTTSVTPVLETEPDWIIVVDDSCPVVNRFGWLVRQWDRRGLFRFVGRDSTEEGHASLIRRLDETPWSLMLLDREGNEWLGPEAIPFILKNLPSGKIAAVTYTVPGTMWVTRKLYYMVSRNRKLFSAEPVKASSPLCDRAVS
jgi:predicted DCC family thiol-disulfide oxidoreductase YuxK